MQVVRKDDRGPRRGCLGHEFEEPLEEEVPAGRIVSVRPTCSGRGLEKLAVPPAESGRARDGTKHCLHEAPQGLEGDRVFRATADLRHAEAIQPRLEGQAPQEGAPPHPALAGHGEGDANGDGLVSISDPISTLGHLFLDGSRLPCHDAADVNDDGILNITDPIYTLGFLFLGGPPPPLPYPEPGPDATGDGLVCRVGGS